MLRGESSIDRVVLRQERQDFHDTRSVAPIPHEIAYDTEQTDELDSCVGHAIIGHVTNEFSGGAGSFDVSPDAVAVLAQRQSAESCACRNCQRTASPVVLRIAA